MKALVGAFNQEKALVGAFSVIVQPVVEPMEHDTALVRSVPAGPRPDLKAVVTIRTVPTLATMMRHPITNPL